jgi:uncharacterized OB-fold protein
VPILERIDQQIQARHWTDSIPLEYHYTAGVAGEEFRRELRDNGKLLTSKCPKCKTVYLPARMFCPSCFVETKERATVTKPGYVYSYTTVSADKSGNKTSEPTLVALVKFDGITGGIVHRVEVSNPEEAAIGLKVEPVLREKNSRTGALTDIVHFRPLGAGPGARVPSTTRLRKETEPEKAHLQNLLAMIDESGYPVGEEELTLAPIREKIENDQKLTREEDSLLHKIVDRAREWHRAEKTSAETEPENTMSG